MNILTPEEIKDRLQDKVVGNEDLLYKLSSIGSMYTMCLDSANKGIPNDKLPSLSLFISGDTGTCKTYSVETLTEILDLPMLRIDCSFLVPSGNDGGINVSKKLECWAEYLENPGRGGILFLDELDKTSFLGSAHNTEWKKSVQSSLLDILSSKFTSRYVKYKGKFKNLLIIGAGAFQSYKDTRETYSKGIGFTEDIDKVIDLKEHRAMLIEAGILPELAGRFTDIAETTPLTKGQVRDLIFNVNSAYGKYLRLNNHVFFLEREDVDTIVEKVLASSAGLRELDGLIFNYFSAIIAKRYNTRSVKNGQRR